MPLTTMSIGTPIGTAQQIMTALSPLSIIVNIITKMNIKVPFLRRLFGRRRRISFIYMPKYKTFISSITKEKVRQRYLLIDIEDYIKTILNEEEVLKFTQFVNDKSDNDLYKEIVGDMVNKIFDQDINTSKRILYFTDNEKIFKLIENKRKMFIYPKTPDDTEYKSIYSSVIENIKKHVIIYKSFSELEDIILHL
jgi:hypothetical protein